MEPVIRHFRSQIPAMPASDSVALVHISVVPFYLILRRRVILSKFILLAVTDGILALWDTSVNLPVEG